MSDDDDDVIIIIRRARAELPVPKKLARSLGMLDALRLCMALFSVVRRR
jgi:hypothetical protein